MTPRRLAVFALLAFAGGAGGQSDATVGRATVGELPPAIIKTLEALGATTGVPDGVGATWEPPRPAAGQAHSLSLLDAQAGVTLPVWTSADQGVFATTSAQGLFARGGAVLPDTRVRFPGSLWEVQAGATFLQQGAGGQSWGLSLAGGSASDRPFHSIHEATVSALAFWRLQPEPDHAWLLYVVSTTNGQIGRNIPIPGAAYEFHTGDVDGLIGLPFLSLTYRPTELLQFDLNYAAVTDVRARASVRMEESLRVFAGFSWVSESWLPADRPDRREQLFWYEKRAEGGLLWAVRDHLGCALTGGYAFDRYFLEARGFTLAGHNHLGLAPGPFVAVQLNIHY